MIYLIIGIIIGVITASSVLFGDNLMTFYFIGEKFIPRTLINYARGGRYRQFARKHVRLPLVREQFATRKVVKLKDQICKLKESSVVIKRRVTALEGDNIVLYD